MSWGVSGWPSCVERITFLVRSFERTIEAGNTPKYWSFTLSGWGSLTCCWPADTLARRRIFRREPGDNDSRLLGLPYVVGETDKEPFVLESMAAYDAVEIERLRIWRTDPIFASFSAGASS